MNTNMRMKKAGNQNGMHSFECCNTTFTVEERYQFIK